MKLPPMLMHLRFSNARHRWPGLWLPLFLLWPITLALLIVSSVIALPLWLLLFVSAPQTARAAIALLGATYTLLCATRGMHIGLEGPTTLSISID